MSADENYTTSFDVAQSPDEVFAAINNVRGWWSEAIDGRTDAVGEIFDYRYEDVHRCRIEITQLVPGRKVAWHVLENFFSFTADKAEWTATDIIFDIAATVHGTKLTLTHIGLVPEFECFEICSDGWGTYIRGSLRSLVETGKGNPNVGEPMTESERLLTA